MLASLSGSDSRGLKRRRASKNLMNLVPIGLLAKQYGAPSQTFVVQEYMAGAGILALLLVS